MLIPRIESGLKLRRRSTLVYPSRIFTGETEMRFHSSALIAATLALSSIAAQAQDLAAGEQSFKKCLPCHSVGEGAANKVGPQLNALDGRKAGTAPGYSYSDANKNSGLVW